MGRHRNIAGQIALLALVLAAASAGAQPVSDAAGPRTLEEYLALARAANPTVRVATSRARAATERVGVARGQPDPLIMYGYYVAPDAMQGRQEFELRQEIPFPGKRGLRGEVASRQAGMAASMAGVTAVDIDFEVKMAFYRYVGLTETARVLEAETALLGRMRDVAQIRYASGTAEQQEVLKTELSLSQIADETTLNRREIEATRARLNELVGRGANAPLPGPSWVLPDVSAIDRVALADSALAWRPEIAGAREEIAMAEASRRLAKREYLPDLMLGVDYEFGGGGQGWWELVAGVNLPIWIGKRRAMVREAEAMRESAEFRLEEETLRTTSEVEAAAVRARAARERLERFQDSILPLAEQSFASSEAGYRAGRVEFLDYLDSERMLLEMRKDYAMVIADLGMQMAALERAVGSDLGGK